MFSPRGCRRGFPREPGPWCPGPPPPHARGPPWEHQRRRGRRHRPCPWGPRPFPGPADFPGNEDGRWAPPDCPPPPPWDNGESNQEPEDWHPPCPEDPGPFFGPEYFPGNEDRRWAPPDCPPPPPWDDRKGNEEPEDWHPPPCPQDLGPFPGPDDFHGNEHGRWAPPDCPPPPPWDDREDWHLDLLPPGPGWFTWSGFPDEEQHPPWPPASLPGEEGGFPDDCPSWSYHDPDEKSWRRLRRDRRELTLVPRLPYVRPSKGKQAPRSSASCSGNSRPWVKELLQNPDPPKPLLSHKAGAQSRKRTAQSPPGTSRKVPEDPRKASTPEKSTAAGPQAVTEAVELKQATGATPVEPGARKKPVGSHGQDPSASEAEPAPPEKSPARTEEHPEVEPCSQSVPEAAVGGGSRPQSPTDPPEPTERVHTAADSAGEVSAELCPCSPASQLSSGAGETERQADHDELLRGLQPSQNSQVSPGATAEPDARHSQASSDVCTAPETPPGTLHPPGPDETEPVAGSGHQLSSALPTPSSASTDLRSAAVLARKEEIELSYQQFSLTIAVVATMLLHKEPSMEAALGLALRANLRQGRLHHLQELENFINSYDSATLRR